MDGPIPDNQNVSIVQQDDGERITADTTMDDQRNQVLEGEGDQHLLQPAVGGVSMGSHVPLPVMLAMQGNNNRNDMLNPPMSNMIPQSIRYSNFPTSILQQYQYPGNNTLQYNNDIASGTGSISLAPVTPGMNVNQNSAVQMAGSLATYGNNDLRMQSLDADTQRLMNPYFVPVYLKPSEDICLFNCLTSIDNDNSQVSQQSVLRLLSDILSDAERMAIAKDDNQLAQILQMFLQQHQEIILKNVIYSDEFDVNKKQIEYNALVTLYTQFSASDMILDKDGKNIVDTPWLQPRMYNRRPDTTLTTKGMKNSRPGKPTVLTADEEAILADFVLRLEEKGIRLPREDVGKLVLGILSTLNRPHPFKEDGPHRHWFNGFYKRNPSIMRSRQSSNSIPREQLKEEQINQFLNEIKRLDMSGLLHFAAHHLHLSSLDQNGYHINISQEAATNPLPTFLTPGLGGNPAPLGLDMNDKKFHTKTWTTDQLKWAVDEVANGRATIKDVSDRCGIPVATIRNHYRNPQMGARRGPPTVLTATEELALERFLIKLDDCGYKANKEELSKLVMEIVNSDKRPHPFKEDGPHRHWFDGYYRRHKALLARKKASNNSLSRQEAPPELMKHFFDELNELKKQNGELVEPRAKRQKVGSEMNMISVEGNPINYDITTAMDPTGIAQPPNELMAQIPQPPVTSLSSGHPVPLPASMAAQIANPLTTPMNAPDVYSEVGNKKGGRPKLRLFSVRPNRQKMRVARIMQFIRQFALENQENVDDILWSLLMLRVKGSGNPDLYRELEKLYLTWDHLITSNGDMQPGDMQPLPAVSIQPTLSTASPNPAMGVDIVSMQNAETDYPIHTIQMDGGNIIVADNPDLITRV